MRKQVAIMIAILFAVLLAPAVIALLGILLSPVLSTIGYLAIIFVITVVIAYKNKIGRK